MKMKHILITLLCLPVLFSCNGWLDVDPEEMVAEEDLFATGEGYRNALLGVYKQMASTAMYGCEMTWGTVDVLGQMYNSRRFRTMTNYYKLAVNYNYTDSKIKPVFDGIWSKSYNCIANCNNIISRIQKEDPLFFEELEAEQNLIRGEALALRALLHFDMLRLFAPAPVADDGKNYIPYFENYPSTSEPYKSVKDVLELVERDLLEAKSLVAEHDTINHRALLSDVGYRVENRGEASEIEINLFYLYRAYRMNYFAITALLARVYNYMGEYDAGYYKKAYDQAQEVIMATTNPQSSSSYYRYFKFTAYYYAEDERKLYDGIIFTLANPKLPEIYTTTNDYSNNSIEFVINGSKATIFDDNSDVRGEYLIEPSGSYYAINKYKPHTTSNYYHYNYDMIPMMRLSELYYIQAEYLYRSGETAAGISKMDAVRDARGCTIGKLNISNQDDFNRELIKEARRDFMQEGQLFYYYKRLNVKPLSSMPAGAFVLPLPDSEVIN